jgi:poly-gamma-glutamate synthesis protein (capsule biosynthesis protein)
VEQAKRKSDIVIVCAHGGNELMPLPSAQRRQQLQRLVDAGADLVIGHHPHVPQGWEQYANGYIFYSLGDFYFDSIDGNRYDYSDWGFIVRASIDEGRITTLEIVPYERCHDKIGLLGTHRDAASHVSYLKQLTSILTSPDFEGYWQQLAVNRLFAYRPFFRSRFTYPRLSFRKCVRKSLTMADELLSLWRPLRRPKSPSTGNSQTASEVEALGILNAIRCESHRWAIETAFAVLGGETKDRRSPEIRDKLKALSKFNAYRENISAY